MQSFNNQSTNNENTPTLQHRRRDNNSNNNIFKKKGIIISTILFFILSQIFIYIQGKHYLTTLKNEINEWKSKYERNSMHLKRSEQSFAEERLKWKEHIDKVHDSMHELDSLHDKEEEYWKNMFLKVSKDYDSYVSSDQQQEGPVLPPLSDGSDVDIKADTAASFETQKEEFISSSSTLTGTSSITNENDNQSEKEETNNNNQETKMNILLLYADDWRHDTFGAAGNPVIKTPNLDKMSKDGIMFKENCVTTSICWISRGTLQTGQYLSRHKSPKISNAAFVNNRTAWDETYNYLLRKNGYHTGFIGKWHYHQFPEKEFDVAKQYYGWHVSPDGKRHITTENERDGLDFLRHRPQDKPFALTVSFFATHAIDGNPNQFIPQNKSLDLYKDIEIPTKSSVSQESWERLPYFFTDRNEGRIRWKWRFNAKNKYQHMMKNYYRMATEVDTVVGNVIQELKDQGVYNNTLIIFTTDNGYYHGEHGLADKWYPHQESIRVPLVIFDPRMDENKKGIPNNDFTLNIDLAPTILSAAGIAIPNRMQGRDMSQLYTTTSKSTKWRDEFYYEHPSIDNQEWWIPTSEALVRKNYKYIYWTHYKMEQLFDLINDPLEEIDLVKQLELYNDIDFRESSTFFNNDKNIAVVQNVLEDMRLRFQELKEAAK